MSFVMMQQLVAFCGILCLGALLDMHMIFALIEPYSFRMVYS